MSFYVAGIHLTSSMGKTWAISPAMGDLTSAEAGFVTPLGSFASSVTTTQGSISGLNFSTPLGTVVSFLCLLSVPSSWLGLDSGWAQSGLNHADKIVSHRDLFPYQASRGH
jgi:hypothetical protein